MRDVGRFFGSQDLEKENTKKGLSLWSRIEPIQLDVLAENMEEPVNSEDKSCKTIYKSLSSTSSLA